MVGAPALLVALVALVSVTPGSVAAAATGAAATASVGAAPEVPAGTARVGTLASSKKLQVTVTLQPRDPAGLSALARAVSTPGTAQYRHYLTGAGFDSLFAPTAATVAAVVAGLRAEGLHTGAVAPDHLSVAVTATAGQLSRAFATTLATVRLPSGRLAYADTSAPRMATALAPVVQGVIGLDDLAVDQPLDVIPARRTLHPRATPHDDTDGPGPSPCSQAIYDAEEDGVYTADQLADAYQFTSFYGAPTPDLGAGETIALFELEPNLPSDIDTYQNCYGTSTTVNYIPVDGGSGTGPGKGEAALDIEDLIGLAPGATIDVYQGPNSGTGVYDTYSAIVNAKDPADVVSTSWGECEALEGASAADAENTLFQQAAVQGQSVVAASGDNGSEDCQPQDKSKALAVDDPSSQPYVTGVGGTTLSQIGPPPTEKVWNEAPVKGGSGGGGISELWAMPSYQSGTPADLNVINNYSSGAPCKTSSGDCRQVPDVSADADPYTGYLILLNGEWSAIGGTSASTPLFASFLALTDASSGCGGTSIGFANPVLYQSAATDYADDFNDITVGDNDYTGTNNNKFPAGTGYDMASGLGSPDGASLPEALCSDGATAPAIVSGPSGSATVGSALSFDIVTSGSPASTITETGALPGGVTLVDNGNGTATLAGTPADGSTGTYPLTFTATNGTAPDATQDFSLTVGPASLTITASTTYMTEGGTVPIITPSYSGFVNSDSAANLASAPVCSTTATSSSADGVYPSSCTGAADADYDISYVNGTVSVESGFYVTTLSLPEASPEVGYSQQLEAVGGKTPYTWRVNGGALPKGLRLTERGLLEGTPKPRDEAGTYTFDVRVVDSTKRQRQVAVDSFTLSLS